MEQTHKLVPASETGKNLTKPRVKYVYPVRKLEIGQSFFIPGGTYASAYDAAKYTAKKHNRKFAIRVRTESGVRGVRVWRTE